VQFHERARHTAASSTASAIGWGAGAAVATGAAVLAYASAVERTLFQLREENLAILPPGSRPLRILHLSDIHMVPGQQLKTAWLHRLAELQPDLVVNTGDNLSHPRGVDALLDALGPLMNFPGVFVPGSNDYYAPRRGNPLAYLAGPSRRRGAAPPEELPWRRLFAAFGAAGWTDLTNRNQSIALNGLRLDFSGVDDPHLDRDVYTGFPAGSSTADHAPYLRIAVAHAPYQRVLDYFTDGGAELILAGHTHGGQLCIPGYGALVTNCDLPTWRARGVTRWEHAGRTVPLNVSAGIGTSRYAPVRFACRPEAALLTLTAV
jgi:predicted MPP superfamily phosphohydrolase